MLVSPAKRSTLLFEKHSAANRTVGMQLEPGEETFFMVGVLALTGDQLVCFFGFEFLNADRTNTVLFFIGQQGVLNTEFIILKLLEEVFRLLLLYNQIPRLVSDLDSSDSISLMNHDQVLRNSEAKGSSEQG